MMMTLEWASNAKPDVHHGPNERGSLLRSTTLPVQESLAWVLSQATEESYYTLVQVQHGSDCDHDQGSFP